MKEMEASQSQLNEEHIRRSSLKSENGVQAKKSIQLREPTLSISNDKRADVNAEEHEAIHDLSTGTSQDLTNVSKGSTTIHYISPTSPLSGRTIEEGDIFEDYMRFCIEPFEKVSFAELSSLSSSYISCTEPELQRTVVIVKPDAMIYKDAALRAIFEAGFKIIGSRVLHLTPEQVSEIYAKHYGSPSFPHLVVAVSSGPVLAISIAAANVINKWKQIIGPDGSLRDDWFYPISMRVRFGLVKTMPNTVHGSDNLQDSNRENRYLFPGSILEPLVKEEPKVFDYCDLYLNKTLVEGLTEVVKKKPIDPILFLADWLLINNPFQPRLPYRIAVTPT